MSMRSVTGKLLAGRTKAIVGGALVVLLLAPIPGYAITFLGPDWLFTIEKSGGPPISTTSFTDNSTGGTLTIDMGQYSAASQASSKIKAKRDFTVAPGGESVDISSAFETLAFKSDVKVGIKIKPLNGGDTIKLPVFFQAAGNTPSVLSTNDQFNQFLAEGTYKMIVKVKYTKKTAGTWDNQPPGSTSPHQFTFSGV
jgi:hypothetical protein